MVRNLCNNKRLFLPAVDFIDDFPMRRTDFRRAKVFQCYLRCEQIIDISGRNLFGNAFGFDWRHVCNSFIPALKDGGLRRTGLKIIG